MDEFNKNIGELEEILQKIASDIASGMLFEKLPPPELLKKTENYISRLSDSVTHSEDLMLMLKPEKAYTVKSMCKNLTQTLTTFKEILIQNTSDPLANSRLALEQLRKALADGSDLLFLMREIRDNPSPLMAEILAVKRASEAKGSVVSIHASEDVQPLIKYVLGRVDDLREALMGLEKKVGEMKQVMRELQEESLKVLSSKTSGQPSESENKTENKQLSMSNFKGAEN
ncbi:MAG: hypothetical protein OEY22_07565 [Candidatus Bathyarchaeota archaeon]|nr:hypothetical protein [Candidatus Bathyarchaeota archaeon]